MADIDRSIVRRLAQLAQLELDEAAEAEMESDLRRILAWCEKLKEVDTEGVEPLYFLVERADVWRPDVPAEPLERAEALRNAPDSDGDYFRVPKSVIKSS